MKKFIVIASILIGTNAFAAKQTINNGETMGQARTKINSNFTEVYTQMLVGDCTVGPCLDGTSDGGTLIKLYGPGTYWTALQAGNALANRSWRLPIDAPPSSGTTRLMNMDEFGQMGFVDPATFATPTGSAASMTVDASGFNGNLATTDNTIQEIAQKVDDLVVSGGSVSDTAYGVSWNGDTTTAPSKNAIYDKIETIAGGTMTYPGAGIPNSTGSAWGTSYALDTDLSSTSASDDTIPSAKATKALFDSLPPITWGTGLTDTANTISVTYPVTAEAWSGGGWNGDTDGLTRDNAYDYLHIADTDDDGLPNKVDVGDGIPKVTSNVLSVATAGTDYTTPSTTETFTNKTLDANGTGNTLKGYGYITFTKPHNRGSATGAVGTTETSILYGVPSFADDVETNNYVDYIGEVPRDLDTAVDLVAYFKFRLGGADTGDHSYKISMIDVADSGTAAGTPGDSITLAYTADASGADGDVETATGTLTYWKTNATAGSYWLIRVTRDGDDATNDTSTVDSYPLELTIRYGFSQ